MTYLQELMARLDRPPTRMEALRELRLLGPGPMSQLVGRCWLRSAQVPVEVLGELLNGGVAAAEALTQIVLHRLSPNPDPAQLRPLMEELGRQGLLTSGEAAPIRDALRPGLPASVAEVLAAVLADRPRWLQVDMARRLGRRPEPATAAVLATAARHPDAVVRRAVAAALALPRYDGHPAARTALGVQARDVDSQVAQVSARALARWARANDAAARADLVSLLTMPVATGGRRVALDVAEELGLVTPTHLASQETADLRAAWLTDLACGRPSARRFVRAVLEHLGEQAVVEAMEHLQTGHDPQPLLDLADPRTAPALVELSLRTPRPLRDACRQVLSTLGSAAFEATLAHLPDERVLCLLRPGRRPEAWVALRQAIDRLPSGDPTRRELMTTSMAADVPGAVDLALEVLRNERPNRPTFSTLGRSGDSRAVELLSQRLESLPGYFVCSALEALRQLDALADLRVGQALLRRLRLRRREHHTLSVLAQHHAEMATEVLLAVLPTASSADRLALVEYLERVPHEPCVTALRRLAQDEDERVRERANQALSAMDRTE